MPVFLGLRRDQGGRAVQQIDSMNADELDMEMQARIAEHIRQQNVQSNMESAWEHSPEVFSDVYMLYVSMQVSCMATDPCMHAAAVPCGL